jgi:outer membrane protein OmpA-like peptidoglycan-associated protein
MTRVRALIWTYITFFLLFGQALSSQDLSFSASVLSFDFNRNTDWNPFGDDLEFPSGAGIFVGLSTSRFLTIGANLRMGKVVNAKDELIKHTEGRQLLNANASVRVQDNSTKNWLSPYIQLGAGGNHIDNDDGIKALVKFDLGLDLRLYQNMYLSLGSSFSREASRSRYFLDYGLGFTMKFNDKSGLQNDDDDPFSIISNDLDGDGISNAEDKCPEEIGTLLSKGCPDMDGDGVADSDDDCPSEVGLAGNNGCPIVASQLEVVEDSDPQEMINSIEIEGEKESQEKKLVGVDENLLNDEIKARQDSMDVAEFIVNEHQDDALIEKADSLVDNVIKSDSNYISDENSVVIQENILSEQMDGAEISLEIENDSSSVNVETDPVDKRQYEEELIKDSDGDGISDEIDPCPLEFGSLMNRGCPESNIMTTDSLANEVNAGSFQFHSVVKFESGLAALNNDDFHVLNEIKLFLKEHPEYDLKIYGHTDEQGSRKVNDLLSKRRARACYTYLSLHGIKKERISYTGEGELKPVALGNNESSRQANRRVVFEFVAR